MPLWDKKKPLKSSSPEPKSYDLVTWGIQHQGLKLYKIYINNDPGMTLTRFLAHLSRRLKGELIVYQSSFRLCVCVCVCKHFQT